MADLIIPTALYVFVYLMIGIAFSGVMQFDNDYEDREADFFVVVTLFWPFFVVIMAVTKLYICFRRR